MVLCVVIRKGIFRMAQAQKQVRIIEPLERFVNRINLVGCYARVSSDSEDQLNSYNNQVDFYESYVNSLENSKLVKIYTDEGITGTRMDKRDGFLQMIEDCRKGLINRIITKSISRFARNITETLSVVRELKSIGVSVYFMTEKIDTAKMGSEMMLAVLKLNQKQFQMYKNGHFVQGQKKEDTINQNCHMDIKE